MEYHEKVKIIDKEVSEFVKDVEKVGIGYK